MADIENALIVRMEASLRKFERQMEAGRKAAEKSAKGSENAWRRSGDRITANANRAATGLQRMTNVSGRGRFVLQNTANQIGDIAVQMGAGTSASRALGQQLPQLFGGFAALGGALGLLGPLLGTAAALAIPLGAAFVAMGDDAGDLDDQIKELSESLAALQAAQKRASTSATDLIGDYGNMADEARALFEIEKQMAQIRATAALDTATRGIAGELGVGGALDFVPDNVRNVEAVIDSLKEERRKLDEATHNLSDTEFKAATERVAEINEQIKSLRTVSRNFDDLADNLGITEEAAREVAAQFAAIGQADSTAARAEAMQDLVSYIKEASNNLADAEDEGRELYGQLLDAALKALELSKVDVASNIRAGTVEAAALKGELAAALELFNRINLAESKQYSGRGGDPRDFMPGGSKADYEKSADYKPVEQIIEELTPRSGGTTGGGGGGSRVDPRVSEAAQVYEKTRTEAEKYAAELANLNELREAGFITEDTHLRAVQQLGEQFEETGNIGQRMGQTISGALADMVVDFDNARDAAANLLSQLASMFANSAFQSLGLDGIFGGLFGNADGNAFAGGKVAAFASGGVVSGPTMFPMRGSQTGLMGEAGPEAIMPLTRMANGKLGVQSQGGGGGMVSVQVSLSEDLDARIQQTSENVSARITRQGIEQYDRAVLPRSVRQINADPRKVG